MFIDLRPLRRHRDFQYLFFGQIVSFLGSMVTYVAVPWQVYELTKSSLIVGFLSAVQLVPTLFFGLLGGSFADAFDRRRVLLISEAVMALCSLGLALNAYLGSPSVVGIFVLAGLLQSANAFHRPAMEALTQKLVDPDEYSAVAALGAFRHSIGAILGPALGGFLIAHFGALSAYLVDFVTFGLALISLSLIRSRVLHEKAKAPGWQSVKEGLVFASKRPELLGTYFVDIVAMTFAFPIALFPALGEAWGGAREAGLLFTAMSVGSLAMTLLSGWSGRIRRHGAAVILAAGLWGLAIVGFGLATEFWWAFGFLVLAGAFDMVSGLYRGTIWNETIPNEMRGRLAGIEMISYMAGPLLGNMRAGWMATEYSNKTSIVGGGIFCVLGIVCCGFVLPRFWAYRSSIASKS